MKPRIWRIKAHFWGVEWYAWRCFGGGILEVGSTAAEAYAEWSKAYNKPWRRAARWVKQLKKEAA